MKNFLGRTFDYNTQTYRFSDESSPPITTQQKDRWDNMSRLEKLALMFGGKRTLGRGIASLGLEDRTGESDGH
jgi:hypothetical protein